MLKPKIIAVMCTFIACLNTGEPVPSTPSDIPPVETQQPDTGVEIISTEIPAVETQTVETTGTKGVIQIEYGYFFSDGSFDPWISVPGVAVGKNTILADDVFDIVRTDNPIYQKILAERKDGYATLGVDLTDIAALKAGCVIMVYDGSDYLKHGNLQIKESSNGTNYSIITTEETLSRYTVFSPDSISLGQTVYASGFTNQIMDTTHYANTEDILEQVVTINGLNDDGTINFTLDSSESFVALVNESSEVVGLIVDIVNGTGRAVASTDIESYLDQQQIKYSVGKQTEAVLTANLKNAIKDAEAVNKELYTEDSYQYLEQALESGKKVLNNQDASQKDVDTATNDIINAMNNLSETEQKSYVMTIVIIAMVVILSIVFVVFLIKTLKHPELLKKLGDKQNKKKASVSAQTPYKKQQPQQAVNTTQTASPQISIEEQIPAFHTAPKQGVRSVPEGNVSSEAATSVLTANMQDKEPVAYFIRQSTGERINIDVFPFTLGKSAQASYQITNNEAISRIHCRIAWLNGELVIFDNDSTNHTYIDGCQIASGTPFPIKNGTEIVLANEAFIAYIS